MSVEIRDILNALDRQAAQLELRADQLAAKGDYSAEFPSEDARMLREAHRMLSGARDSQAVAADQHARAAYEASAPWARPWAELSETTHEHWRAVARAVLAQAWEPQFDACSVEQERLVREFCFEIAGPRGKKGSPPDPVRLLEMAQALYEAERNDLGPRANT